MSRFTMTIDTDNDAFAEDPQAEVARILRRVARTVVAGSDGGRCMDINGNAVGSWEFTPDAKPG